MVILYKGEEFASLEVVTIRRKELKLLRNIRQREERKSRGVLCKWQI